ncbi:MAG: DUF2497 domain-containing protein [Sphingomonadaceae bacterium]
MNAKPPSLDPNLAAILASIRQTVSGDTTAPAGASAADADAPAEDAPAEGAPADGKPAPPEPVRPALRRNLPPSGKTVEEFLADLIRPQVEAWLAQHLPEIVQQLAAEEIRRLTGKG